MNIKLLLGFLILLLVYIILYYTIRNNKSISLQNKPINSYQSFSSYNPCSANVPGLNVSTVSLVLFADEQQIINASSIDDLNVTYYWEIYGNENNINPNVAMGSNTNSTLIIPANRYLKSGIVNAVALVKSKNKPFLTNAVLRKLNIVNAIPTITSPIQDTYNAQSVNSFSYIIDAYVNEINNKHVIYTINVDDRNLVVNNNYLQTLTRVEESTDLATNITTVLYPKYRFIPFTSNLLSINITYSNKTYTSKKVSKLINIYWSLPLNDKFTISLLRITDPNWMYLYNYKDTTFRASVTENNTSYSNYEPLLSKLVYTWDLYTSNNNIISIDKATYFQTQGSELILKKEINSFLERNFFKLRCTISYGNFSIPLFSEFSVKTVVSNLLGTDETAGSGIAYNNYDIYSMDPREISPKFQVIEYYLVSAPDIIVGVRIPVAFIIGGFIRSTDYFLNGYVSYMNTSTTRTFRCSNVPVNPLYFIELTFNSKFANNNTSTNLNITYKDTVGQYTESYKIIKR